MIALIQRVTQASVEVEGEKVSEIGRGILAFIAIQQGDSEERGKRLLKRMLNYRIFPDEQGKMNLSLRDVQGEILLVSQFTLAADTKNGNRPSFSTTATPEVSKQLFDQLVVHAREEYSKVQQGVFGADMQITLNNDGPVTFWLEV